MRAVIPVGVLVACLPALEPPQVPANPDHDFDGDGQSEVGGDCDDADPMRFTGAPELCDGRQNDCSGPWEPGDEAGVVTGFDASGRAHFRTVAFRGGFLGEPRVVTLEDGFTYRMCEGIYLARVVDAGAGQRAVLEGVGAPGAVVLNAAFDAAGGSVVELSAGGSELTLRNLQLTGGNDGWVAELGGGATVGAGLLRMEDCIVSINNGNAGAGLRVGGRAEVVRTVIEQGFAKVSAGGIQVDGGGSLLLEDSFVRDNQVNESAGGLHVMGDAVVRRTVFEGHDVPWYGGSIIVNGGTLLLEDSHLDGDRAGLGGGALVVWGGHALVRRTSITRGEAPVGGGVQVTGGVLELGAGVALTDNVAVEAAGAALHLQGMGTVTCAGASPTEPVRFEGNRAPPGGAALYVDAGEATFTATACHFAGNDPADGAVAGGPAELGASAEVWCDQDGCLCDGQSC